MMQFLGILSQLRKIMKEFLGNFKENFSEILTKNSKNIEKILGTTAYNFW